MRIPVGPMMYELSITHDLIPFGQGFAEGLCDRLHHRILISMVPPPARRLATF